MPQPDIQILLQTSPNGPGFPLSTNALEKMQGVVQQAIAAKLRPMMEKLEAEIGDAYRRQMGESSEGSELREAILDSLHRTVEIRGDQVFGGAFNVTNARAKSSYTSRNGNSGDVFSLFERPGGAAGNANFSTRWGFIYRDHAVDLANDAVDRLGIRDTKRGQNLLNTVADRFSGKTGEGIMVYLGRGAPLFYDVPEFGEARTYIDPHRGFDAWNILWKTGTLSRHRRDLERAVDAAFAEVSRDLGRTFGR